LHFKKWGAQAWEPYISLRLCTTNAVTLSTRWTHWM